MEMQEIEQKAEDILYYYPLYEIKEWIGIDKFDNVDDSDGIIELIIDKLVEENNYGK